MPRSHAAPEDPAVTLAAEAALANPNYANEEVTGAHAGRHAAAGEAGSAAVSATVSGEEDRSSGRHRAPEAANNYRGRRRADPDDEEAPVAAADTDVAPTGEITLLDPPTAEVLDRARGIVQEYMTEPKIKTRIPAVRRSFVVRDWQGYPEQVEPEGGYYAPVVKTFGKEARGNRDKMRAQANAGALAKAPQDRTDFEDFMLAIDESTRAKTRDPSDNYADVDLRVLKALRDGHMPEEFRDVESLERATAFMIEAGFAHMGFVGAEHRSTALMDAVNILREATLRVPGFNPVRAGLTDLYDRATFLTAAMNAESYHWGAGRSERGSSTDHGSGMVAECLAAAEYTTAALLAQDRIHLLGVPVQPAQ